MSNVSRESFPLTLKIFAIIIERYVVQGKEEKATQVFLSMPQYGCPLDLSTFNAFLDTLCKARKAQRAERLFRGLRYQF